MADREIMAKLFEATTDDDSKVPEATAKAIVKAACKSKNEAALRDMAQWLADRLEKSDSCTVKIKVIRVLMQIMSQPKATAFTRIFADLGADVVEQTVTFSCEPDPVHGEKPAEYVRNTATKCLALLPAKSGGGDSGASADRGADSGGGGGAVAATAAAAAPGGADAAADGDASGIKKRVEARAKEARAKAEEAKTRMEAAAAEARAKAEAAAQTAKAAAMESIDAVTEDQSEAVQPEAAQRGDDAETEGNPAAAAAAASSGSPEPAPEPAVDVAQPREEVVQLPLGASMEVTIESRSKTIYEISVSPDDFEVQWEFTLDSHDVIFGASFAPADGSQTRVIKGWAPKKYEAGTDSGSFRATSGGSLRLEWDNTYSRMRSKTLSFQVQSMGAGVTVVPCRWEMGQGEWDPFLQTANAKPVWESLPTLTVQVTHGASWADLARLIVEQHAEKFDGELTIVGTNSRNGAGHVPMEFPGDEHLAVMNYCGGTGQDYERKRVLSVVEHTRVADDGSFGHFTSAERVLLDTDTLPEDLLTGQTTVQLQLATTAEAWAYHAAAMQPATAVEESIAITDTKEEDKKTFYEVTWIDKRGRKHVVWKRYSRFDTLRSELIKHTKEVKDLPFPPKKKIKSKSDKTVGKRTEALQAFLEGLVMGGVVQPVPFEDDGLLLFTFLTGESDL